MIRTVVVMALLALVPAAPALAVVAIEAAPVALPVGPVVRPRAIKAAPRSSGPNFGELVAALIGLGVLGMTLANSRQPNSVAA